MTHKTFVLIINYVIFVIKIKIYKIANTVKKIFVYNVFKFVKIVIKNFVIFVLIQIIKIDMNKSYVSIVKIIE